MAYSKAFLEYDAIYKTASNSNYEGLPLVLSQIDLGCKLYFAKTSCGTKNLLFLKPNGTLLKYSQIPIFMLINYVLIFQVVQ